MVGIRFEWDNRKNAANKRKHGIDFVEASSAFSDEHGLLIADPDYPDDEERFVLLGLSSLLRVLVVCPCYREQDEVIRIISARKAGRSEQKQYSRKGSR